MQIHIHIKAENYPPVEREYDLSIIVEMPYVPRKDEFVYLTQEQETELESKIEKWCKEFPHMAPDFESCFFGRKGNKHCSVSDFYTVSNVATKLEDSTIWVELNS